MFFFFIYSSALDMEGEGVCVVGPTPAGDRGSGACSLPATRLGNAHPRLILQIYEVESVEVTYFFFLCVCVVGRWLGSRSRAEKHLSLVEVG